MLPDFELITNSQWSKEYGNGLKKNNRSME